MLDVANNRCLSLRTHARTRSLVPLHHIKAGGIWEWPPFEVEPADKAGRWAITTLNELCSLHHAAATTAGTAAAARKNSYCTTYMNVYALLKRTATNGRQGLRCLSWFYFWVVVLSVGVPRGS